MKCPKCQYISFDSADRCRNCGFELALAAPPGHPPDLVLRPGHGAEGPPQDFALRAAPAAPSAAGPGRGVARSGRGHTPGGLDLPLFEAPVPGVDDTPLIRAPATPRPPLSVRRQAPDSARRATVAGQPRGGDTDQAGDFDDAFGDPAPLLPDLQVVVPEAAPASARAARPAPRTVTPSESTLRGPAPRAAAPAGRRVVAALVDGAILAAVDAVVVYLTLQLTGVPGREVLRLPVLPLLGFLALLNGGYLVSFTVASGQTIGKMLAGIRVVAASGSRVPLGSAAVRAAATVVSVLPLGIGCVPLFTSADRLTLHDRLSSTRVVRA
jgi:uncharacterized RDD family membrane protein YckC